MNRIEVPEERITVIHHASEIDSSISYGKEAVPDQPYFLYVGSRAPYKNFDGLCRALAKVAKTEDDIKLCVVGSPFDSEELKLIGELGLAKLRLKPTRAGTESRPYKPIMFRSKMKLICKDVRL